MRRVLVVLAVVMAVATAGLSAVASATEPGPPPLALPATPVGLVGPVPLPVELDPVPAYVPQTACNPGTPAGVASFRALVLSTYGMTRLGNTARGCNEGTSEHSDGRAWDFMVDADKPAEVAAAADLLAWITAGDGVMARRLGIMYVIYRGKIWGAYRAGDGWRPSSGHADHVHVSFSFEGARGETSFWTGKVAPVARTWSAACRVFAGQPAVPSTATRLTPCPVPSSLLKTHTYGVVQLGTKKAAVKKAQKVLKVKRTGRLDTATFRAVKAYQGRHDLPVTGALDVPTWSSLLPTKVRKSVVKGWSADRAADHGAASYGWQTLQPGSAGGSVIVLQTALGMKAADRNGYFGPVTAAAVLAFQRATGLPETGTVTAAEWAALAR